MDMRKPVGTFVGRIAISPAWSGKTSLRRWHSKGWESRYSGEKCSRHEELRVYQGPTFSKLSPDLRRLHAQSLPLHYPLLCALLWCFSSSSPVRETACMGTAICSPPSNCLSILFNGAVHWCFLIYLKKISLQMNRIYNPQDVCQPLTSYQANLSDYSQFNKKRMWNSYFSQRMVCSIPETEHHILKDGISMLSSLMHYWKDSDRDMWSGRLMSCNRKN